MNNLWDRVREWFGILFHVALYLVVLATRIFLVVFNMHWFLEEGVLPNFDWNLFSIYSRIPESGKVSGRQGMSGFKLIKRLKRGSNNACGEY